MNPPRTNDKLDVYAALAAYFARPLWKDHDRVSRISQLLVDDRWPWIPWFASFSGVEKNQDRPSVRVGGKAGSTPLVHGLLSPDLSRLKMQRSVGGSNVSRVSLTIGRLEEEEWGYEAPLKLWIISRATGLPSGKAFQNWLALAHDLVTAVGALNATLGIWPSFDMAIGDTWLTRTVLDSPGRNRDLGLPETFAAQIDLLQQWKKFHGRTYARHPRWGTYLNAAHAEASGGIERIRAEVQPAIIETVGELTYIQLTESVDTALTQLSGERRQRLEALMAPILLGARKT